MGGKAVAEGVAGGSFGKKSPDVLLMQFQRMPFAMEDDESLDPIDIGALGAYTVVPRAANLTNLIEQFGLL
jgi:hypothetical protein